ncbi:hypothetical protein DFH09DRAFT_1077274 [Mycena vulgaris]|nr:hypothetical protein DFH09DRAFT_1077274 [Mycena vulgaris]
MYDLCMTRHIIILTDLYPQPAPSIWHTGFFMSRTHSALKNGDSQLGTRNAHLEVGDALARRAGRGEIPVSSGVQQDAFFLVAKHVPSATSAVDMCDASGSAYVRGKCDMNAPFSKLSIPSPRVLLTCITGTRSSVTKLMVRCSNRSKILIRKQAPQSGLGASCLPARDAARGGCRARASHETADFLVLLDELNYAASATSTAAYCRASSMRRVTTRESYDAKPTKAGFRSTRHGTVPESGTLYTTLILPGLRFITGCGSGAANSALVGDFRSAEVWPGTQDSLRAVDLGVFINRISGMRTVCRLGGFELCIREQPALPTPQKDLFPSEA